MSVNVIVVIDGMLSVKMNVSDGGYFDFVVVVRR